MSKQIILTILLIHVGLLCHAQKQDYYWPFGKDQNIELDGVQAFAFDFNKQPFEPILREGEINFDQNNASICDAEGNLLIYTNGCAIANRLGKVMPNGDSLNTGLFFDDFWGGDCSRGYTGPQDITILPDPAYENGYYIIQKPISLNVFATDPDDWFSRDSMLYSYVDMTLENGLGDVTEKNVKFHEASLLFNFLAPIAHENGKDWWITNPSYPNGFLVYSLTENGLRYEKREPGPDWDIVSSAAGHARFSPDGQYYATFDLYAGLFIYAFDRATATFSEERHIPFPYPELATSTTCEWSPNSRFLYAAKYDTLWQLDTWAEPLETGLEFISERTEDNSDPTGRNFGVAALGPDCKLYIRSKSGSRTFHVIHKPDEKGLACDFVNQGIRLPSYSASGSFPNFPRFRVDEEEKCDPSIVSIAGEEIYWRRDLIVYPNPARDYVNVNVPDGQQGDIFILNMDGKIVLDERRVRDKQRMELLGLEAGMYSVEFVPRDNKDRVVYTSQLVVVE